MQMLENKQHGDQKPLLDQLFKRRYDIFVEGRQWSLARKAAAGSFMEIDEYDRADAVYIVDVDEDGSINASVRLNRTDLGTLSADKFPHLYADGKVACSDKIYEGTRYFVAPQKRNPKLARRLRCLLVAEALKYVQAQGGLRLQTVIDAQMLNAYLEMSPQMKVLGGVYPYGGGKLAPGGGECLLLSADATDDIIDDLLTAADLSQRDARARLERQN